MSKRRAAAYLSLLAAASLLSSTLTRSNVTRRRLLDEMNRAVDKRDNLTGRPGLDPILSAVAKAEGGRSGDKSDGDVQILLDTSPQNRGALMRSVNTELPLVAPALTNPPPSANSSLLCPDVHNEDRLHRDIRVSFQKFGVTSADSVFQAVKNKFQVFHPMTNQLIVLLTFLPYFSAFSSSNNNSVAILGLRISIPWWTSGRRVVSQGVYNPITCNRIPMNA